MNILFITGRYGIPFNTSIVKHLNNIYGNCVSIIELPFVSYGDNKFVYNARLIMPNTQVIKFGFNIAWPLPLQLIIPFHYFLNLVVFMKFLIKSKKIVYDIGIAETNYNGAILYFLKKIKLIKHSIFYCGDIVGSIVDGKFEKSFYMKIQMILRGKAYKNDYVCYPSEKVKDWDKMNDLCHPHNLVVKVPTSKDLTLFNISNQRLKKTHHLVYLGALNEMSGIDMLLSVVSDLKLIYPDIFISFIGGAEVDVNKYRQAAQDLEISKNVRFYGFVDSSDDVFAIMSSAIAGLAFYDPSNENISNYTDSGKVKEYIQAGLPVLISKNGPEVWHDIRACRAGLVAEYSPDSIAKCITTLFANENGIKSELVDGVMDLSIKYDYNTYIDKKWSEILLKLYG